tara:strand:+ start:2901 stop:4079 length:1179 start_codon:yes stop_codon:yes gene_type:complete
MSIPQELQTNQVKDFSELDAEVLRISPYGSTSISNTGNKKIEFRLGRNGFLQGTECEVIFDVSSDVNNACPDWAESIFEMVIVKVGNLELCRETEAGFMRNMANNARYSYNARTSASGKSRGSASGVFDAMSSTARKVRVPLYDENSKMGVSSLFKDLLPLYKMDQVKIELHLNSTIGAYAENSATTFTADNFELVAKVVDSPSLRAEYAKDVVRSFQSYAHHQDTLISGASRIASVIPASHQNMTGMIVCSRPTSIVNAVATADKYQSQFDLNGATSGALRIDGTQYPSNKYDYTDSVENAILMERLWKTKSLGSHHDWSDDGSANDSKQYLCFPFESSNNAITGLNTASKTGTIVCDIACAATANQNLDFFVMYNRFYRISANGAVSITS